MQGKDTRFGEYLAGEVRKVQSVYVPVRAGFLLCQLRRHARVKKVHPNPNDEFCMPGIGPNYQIIGEYEHQFREARRHSHNYCGDPVIVQKIRPDGFMLLNGHHRWGAAWRLGYRRIPIKIVNLTQETDIDKMLRSSKHDRRVTLDLDEVVFRREADELCEKKLRFPLNRIYKEHLRLGIPALFHFLARSGYDIWVYSANYYSMGYIRALLRHYHVNVSGVVTGTARKAQAAVQTRKRVEQMIANKYKVTLHIDNDSMLRISGEDGRFEEYRFDPNSSDWSHDVMRKIREIENQEKQ